MRDKDRAWVLACWEAHDSRLQEGATAVNDELFDDKWECCWCCGSDARRLQKCHIVPRSLGGSCAPENIVPLCSFCHDQMPDVADPEATWVWLREKQNWLSSLGMGRYAETITHAIESAKDAVTRSLEVDSECYLTYLRHYIDQCATLHGGQQGQGVFLKSSTLKWSMDKALERAVATGQLSLAPDMFGSKLVNTVPQKKKRRKKK